MALSAAHANFISKTSGISKALLDQTYSLLIQLDALWAGTPDYDTLITQANINTVASLLGAGLTTTNIADALFALAAIKTSITNALPAFTVMASLP